MLAELLPIQSSTSGQARHKETSVNELIQMEIERIKAKKTLTENLKKKNSVKWVAKMSHE